MRFPLFLPKDSKSRAITLILITVFLFPFTSAPAQDVPSSLLPPGTILFGSVRDFSTGSPMPNAVVFLTGFYKDYSTSTDSNGMYFLTSASHLSPQIHKVLASAEGCRSQSKDVVLSSDYLQPPRADFSLQLILPPDIEIDYSKTIVEDIVEYYSPVFYQKTETKGDHSLNGRADYIARFDFDADWNGTTKWLSAKTNSLKAYVYYDIKQTKYYWFIYYAVYHPRDWNAAGIGDIPGIAEHEHDMEAVLLVVLKDGSLYGRLLIAESMAHDSWFNYPIDSLVLPMKKGFDADQAEFGPEICRGLSFEESYGGKHPVAYVQAEGHGIFFDQSDHFLAIFGRPYSCLTDWDKTDFHGGTGIVYRYRAEAEEPKGANDKNVSYDLLKIDELWEKRNNQSGSGVKSPTFEPTYDEDIKDDGKINSQAFNSNYTKEAHPPWTIPNKDSVYGLVSYPIGQEFSDPVSAVASRYIGFVPQPYLSPVLTSPLQMTPSPPYYVGDEINAEFTIANKGMLPITFNVLTVGGLDSDDQVADFTHRQDITLEPSESYKYKGTFTLTKAGKYHFFCAYQTPDDEWNTSIDLGPGLTEEDRIKDITVKVKEEGKALYRPPEVIWTRSFDKEIQWVQETSEGGYILAAGRGKGSWLIKTDPLGQTIWKRKAIESRYGDKEVGFVCLSSIQGASDGGYILGAIGGGPSNGESWDEVWLIKTDSFGQRAWRRIFKNKRSEGYLPLVRQASDGGYILGNPIFDDFDKAQPWLMKTDSKGYKQWEKTFKFEASAVFTFFQETSDGGYILAGMETEANILERWFGGSGWLIKTDSLGQTIWDRKFEQNHYASSVQETSDGGYILDGNVFVGPDKAQPWLMKTDSKGYKQWEKTFKFEASAVFTFLQKTSDRGYILGGAIAVEPEKFRPWLMKTDSKGYKQWEKTFKFESHYGFPSFQETSDGGYILIAPDDRLLIKIGSIRAPQNTEVPKNSTNYLESEHQEPQKIVSTSITYQEEGNRVYEEGKLDEAIEIYKKALALDPDDSSILLILGMTYEDKGMPEMSNHYFEEARLLFPTEIDFYDSRGIIYLQKGKLDKATLDAKKALEIDPNNASSHFLLANIYEAEGKIAEAISEYQIVSDLDQDPKLTVMARFKMGMLIQGNTQI